MDILNKLIGGKQELVIGVTPFPVPDGYAAYGCTVRVDGTIIASVSERTGNAAAVAVINKSWQVALLAGDYISFDRPVTSVTLTATGDSIWLHLEPKLF